MRYFNYEKIAQEAKIPRDKFGALSQALREEFPHDEMMYELHPTEGLCLDSGGSYQS